MKGLRTSVIFGVAFCGISSVFGVVANWGDWDRVRGYAIVGLAIGLMAAPVIQPESFESRVLWQACWGGVSALLIMLLGGADPGSVVLGTFVGVLVGMTARFWLKHLQWP